MLPPSERNGAASLRPALLLLGGMYLLATALAAAPPRPLLPTAHSGVFRAGTPAMMVHSVRNRQQPFSGWSRSTRQTSTSTTTSQFLEAQKPRSMAAAWIDGGVPR